MKVKRLKIALYPILFLSILTAYTSSASATIELTKEELGILSRGGTVARSLPGSGRGSTIAGVSFSLVDAPVEVVWRALNDISAWSNIFPNTDESKIVAVGDNSKAVKMTVGNRLFQTEFYLTASFSQERKELVYALNKTKPHEIEETRGSVKLLPQIGGRTLVAFTTSVKLPMGMLIQLMGGKVVGWIEYRLLSVPQRLKNWVEEKSGNKYRQR